MSRFMWWPCFALFAMACGEADPVCLEVASICHDAAVLENDPDAQDCYDLRDDRSKSAEECEAMREDCEAICDPATASSR
ncbi:MAG: hypothetical protein KC621_03695 [Myxococcales bacterium]|nr:hypothetical protein [Myxococcales bacterium]